MLGQEEDRKSTEQLPQVGSADHDLRVGRVQHDPLGDGRGDSVLEVSVTVN